MTHNQAKLDGLRRPRILVEAARIGAKKYRREYALNRLFKVKRPHTHLAIVNALRIRESEIEANRILADGTYNGCKHIQVLTALIVEAQRS